MLEATVGQRFGRLVLTGYSAYCERRILRVEALCDCGTVRMYRLSDMKSGDTRSCGCIRAETPSRLSHGMAGTRLYRIWKNMHSRCRNPHQRSYQSKALSVCTEWHKFEPFQEWALANGYAADLSIDRIDNSLGYSSENCRWATVSEQARNKDTNRLITINGVTMPLIHWVQSDICSLQYRTVTRRLALGWDAERALTAPKRGRCTP